MLRYYKGCLATLMAVVTLPALAADTSNYADRPEARPIIEALVKEGIDEQHVRALLANAKRQDKILEAIARPAEKTLDWAAYQKIFLQDSRVQQGVAFAQQHRETLDRAEQEYGVPREIILAIIGVETRYGRHMGTYRVLDALATLGFDYPPRAAFFRKQLQALFELEHDAHIDASAITGSYAGAMGYGQFIPTSYQAFAVDYDNDGVTDLVNNPVDAIGSVANYFHRHHWQPGLPVAARARVSNERYKALTAKGEKPSFTLNQAAQSGVTPLSCDNDTLTSEYCFDLPGDTLTALLELNGTEGAEFWLVSQNFYVITRYNHSPLYAMAVLQLSHRLAAALEENT
ncbi:membrane-bound lytic murein transglycosylase B [Alcanivorax hongdengensis A-11-3]|uniref:Membrane-bound lytic murein transglycosylase B n=1 Tax=Alcanivorax hongdengensis A-11-3 TaxID=1177179 RepID=L0WGD8_9GAMM|nr:lytic murein transglycosylase B [Alcanivorax hongdengensis]EKF75789.1 membrane-bound lytic murein transglycosylase B [Alcanivorax hongdengensis A-11-3]